MRLPRTDEYYILGIERPFPWTLLLWPFLYVQGLFIEWRESRVG